MLRLPPSYQPTPWKPCLTGEVRTSTNPRQVGGRRRRRRKAKLEYVISLYMYMYKLRESILVQQGAHGRPLSFVRPGAAQAGNALLPVPRLR